MHSKLYTNLLRYTIRLSIIPVAALLLSFSPPTSGNLSLLSAAPNQCNPITTENQNVGTDEWVLGNQADDTTQQIKGYASLTSVALGDDIDFFVTVSSAMTYTIEIYRMGWYDGLGGRLMQEVGPLDGYTQNAPSIDTTTGKIAAAWDVSYTLTVPQSWTTGIYLAKLINADEYDNYIVFTVRDDDRPADFIYAQPVTTYQAYNNYPDDGSMGKSLYDHNSYGSNTVSGKKRAVKVSFDRPYSANGAGRFINWELPLIRWLEKSGYDIAYTTNIDTHQNGQNLLDYKGFLSPAHDEYWTKEMYDAAENARDGGTNLAFFGANSIYFQVRFENSIVGPDRVLVGYKDGFRDPVTDEAEKTVNWRDINRAEQGLLGVQYITFSGSSKDTYPYVVTNSDHWLYDGTGFVDGDTVPGLVGYEIDQYNPDFPLPANTEYTILGDSPFVSSATDFNGPIDVALAPGPHVISFSLREDGSRLDQVSILELTNAAPPSSTYPSITPATGLSCQSLVQDANQDNAWFGIAEAEQGLVEGEFAVASDALASGGAYVAMPDGTSNNYDGPNSDGVVSVCFDIPTAATYRLLAQTYADSFNANSFFLQVDGMPSFGYTWDFTVEPSYVYDEITTRGIVNANSSIYQAPSGAWVFASGTMSWSWGLDTPNHYFNSFDYVDNRIQKSTENLLNKFINGSPANNCGVVTPTITPTSTPTATETIVPPTETPTNIPTETPTEMPTSTPTALPTETPIPTVTPTPTNTPVPTDAPTQTPIPPADTATPTATPRTPTPTPTGTETQTVTGAQTAEPFQTATPIGTSLPLSTATPTATRRFSVATFTPTSVATPTATRIWSFATATPTSVSGLNSDSYIYIPLVEK